MKNFFYIIFLFFITQNIYGQNRKYYDKLKKEKKNSIAYSKKILNDLMGDEQSKLERLLIIEEQIRKENELYGIITKEMELIENELDTKRTDIASLQANLKAEKDEYAKLINFSWLNKNLQNRMIYILSANSFNNAYKRIVYLKQLSDFRKATSNKIKNSILIIDTAVQHLENLKAEKSSLTDERKSVLDSLIAMRKHFDNLTEAGSEDIDKIIAEIADNQTRRDAVKKHVEEHINQHANQKQPVDTSKSKEDEELTNAFRSLKRRHIAPLRRFVVLHRFGDYRHPKFKNVVIKNDGMELGAKAAIYRGKVTNIVSIPGEGYSIIIKHGEFYSVYANIVEPQVKMGAEVSIGEVIAQLKKGGKMSKMNFQIWHGKTRLNPRSWLKRR